jgi:uncharacterized protein (TIGR02453 family)
MNYFDEKIIDFLKELEQNNNREWFLDNKKRYEEYVKLPFLHFIEDMILRLRDEDSAFCPDPQKAIFRINRDIRFSKDKTPYKTHVSAVLSYGGRKDLESPGIYIELSHKHFSYYGGAYMISREKLLKLRKFIITYKDEFQTLLNESKFKNTFGEILGEENKILPPEFGYMAAQIPLLYKKQLYFMVKYSAKIILGANFSEIIFDHYMTGRNITDFLYEGMGYNF